MMYIVNRVHTRLAISATVHPLHIARNIILEKRLITHLAEPRLMRLLNVGRSITSRQSWIGLEE